MTHDEMEPIMHKIEMVNGSHGLKVNKKKTRIIIINRTPTNTWKIRTFEVVDMNTYRGESDVEIKRRLSIARN